MENNSYIELPLENKRISNVILVVGVLAMMVSTWAICYSLFFMKLNRMIKSLLICSFIHHLVIHILNFWSILHLTYFATNDDNFTCIILTINSLVILPVHFLCNACVSVIKLYIAWKTKHQKIPKIKKILKYIFACFFFHYLLKSYLAYFRINGSVNLFKTPCLNRTETVEPYESNLFLKLSLLLTICISLVGIICDVLMYLFVKRSNTIDQEMNKNEPIPWKSGDHSEIPLKIPVLATLISTFSAILVAVSAISFYSKVAPDKETILYFLCGVPFLFFMILEPTIIFLTIKNKRNDQKKPQGIPMKHINIIEAEFVDRISENGDVMENNGNDSNKYEEIIERTSQEIDTSSRIKSNKTENTFSLKARAQLN